MTRILDGVRDIYDNYDAYLLDLWGVTHNGIAPFPGVVDLLERMQQDGKRIIMLSNAPREWNKVAQFLGKIGITPAHYNHIVTSGDAARHALATRDEAQYQHMGRRFFHIGPKRDEQLLDAMNYQATDKLDDTDFLLCSGYDDPGEDEQDFSDILTQALDKELPMVCINPDYVAIKGDQALPCAGHMALDYENRGGTVYWYGKPYRRVYDFCLANAAAGIDQSRILMVGDTLRTDIDGANTAGLASALCVGGIESKSLGVGHGEKPTEDAVAALIKETGTVPTYILPGLYW